MGRSLSAAAVVLVVAAPLRAQEASVLLGAVHTRYADTVSGTAGSAGARLGWRSPVLTAVGEAYYTRFTTGEWATQVTGGLVALTGLGRSAAIGIRADGTHSYLQGGFWSGIAAAGPMLGVAGGGWILGISGTAGGLQRIDETSDALATGSARVSRMLGPWSFDLRASGTWAGETRYADILLASSYSVPAFTASLLAGLRTGDLADDPWAQARVEWRALRYVSFEVAVGSYPEDITGFLSGFFANAGIRLGWHTPPVPSLPPSPVTVERISPLEARVTFTVPNVRTVAVAGEWNAWTPMPLSRVGNDQWQIVLRIGAGVHRFSLIVDDTQWTVPEGVATLPDDFGGEVGLLVISDR